MFCFLFYFNFQNRVISSPSLVENEWNDFFLFCREKDGLKRLKTSNV